jgi:hypothetical protein
MRDRAVLATLLNHGLRRDELCALHLVELQERRGVRSLRVHGKGGKIRYVPLHRATAGAIAVYVQAAGHGADKAAPLFEPVSNNTRGAGRAITPGCVYQMLAKCAADAGIEVNGFGPHALRATTATNALEHNADIARVQQWLGHSNLPTMCVYNRRAVTCVPRIADFQGRILKVLHAFLVRIMLSLVRRVAVFCRPCYVASGVSRTLGFKRDTLQHGYECQPAVVLYSYRMRPPAPSIRRQLALRK